MMFQEPSYQCTATKRFINHPSMLPYRLFLQSVLVSDTAHPRLDSGENNPLHLPADDNIYVGGILQA